METCTIFKKLDTPQISAPTPKSHHGVKPWHHKNALPTPSPVFSAQSWEELTRAVHDCCRDEISSQDDDPSRPHGPIDNWDVSQVTEMDKMFSDLEKLDYTLSNLDVSRVTDMTAMFHVVKVFNQDLSNWDVSRVTRMTVMFYSAMSFNQDLSNWDVTRVTDMGVMFRHATSFNQDLSNWDVSHVSYMRVMFDNAESFNHNLLKWGLSRVTYTGAMFPSCDILQPRPVLLGCVPSRRYAGYVCSCKFFPVDTMRCGVRQLEDIESWHVYWFTWVHIGCSAWYVWTCWWFVCWVFFYSIFLPLTCPHTLVDPNWSHTHAVIHPRSHHWPVSTVPTITCIFTHSWPYFNVDKIYILELWGNEILEYVNGVDSHDDGSESSSDSDYKN